MSDQDRRQDVLEDTFEMLVHKYGEAEARQRMSHLIGARSESSNKKLDDEAQDYARMGVILGKSVVDWLRANMGSVELSLRVLAKHHVRSRDVDMDIPRMAKAAKDVETADENIGLALAVVLEPLVKSLDMEDGFTIRS